MNFEWDANGIHTDGYDHRWYRRYALFMKDGVRMLGGVYIGQSTETELLVERFTCAGHDVEEGVVDYVLTHEVWEATGELMTVPMADVFKVIQPYDSTPII